jgi:hypothetical protein
LHDEELAWFLFPSDLMWVIKCRMGWARHLSRMGESVNTYRVLVGNPEGTNNLENVDEDGSIILKLILQKYRERPWTGCVTCG